jgi:hypothetical protein
MGRCNSLNRVKEATLTPAHHRQHRLPAPLQLRSPRHHHHRHHLPSQSLNLQAPLKLCNTNRESSISLLQNSPLHRGLSLKPLSSSFIYPSIPLTLLPAPSPSFLRSHVPLEIHGVHEVARSDGCRTAVTCHWTRCPCRAFADSASLGSWCSPLMTLRR